VDRITTSFWALVCLLVGTAVFYGVGAEEQRRGLQKASAKIESGALVRLSTVVDGGTIIVANEQGDRTTVSILGIRSVAGRAQRDALATWGEAAEEAIERLAAGKPVRVMLHSVPRDRQGRTLATLFVGDEDLGLRLVTDGLALVYPVHPFASLPLYLREQDSAKSARRGLWSHPDAERRAQILALEWQKQAP
jgi:micrococcal nuclease